VYKQAIGSPESATRLVKRGALYCEDITLFYNVVAYLTPESGIAEKGVTGVMPSVREGFQGPVPALGAKCPAELPSAGHGAKCPGLEGVDPDALSIV